MSSRILADWAKDGNLYTEEGNEVRRGGVTSPRDNIGVLPAITYDRGQSNGFKYIFSRSAGWKKVTPSKWINISSAHQTKLKTTIQGINKHLTSMDSVERDEIIRKGFTNADTVDGAEHATPIRVAPRSEADKAHAAMVKAIRGAVENKPTGLYISDLKWKTLYRAVQREKNIMMTGEAGTGKTVTAYELAKEMGRELFVFNLGATQDPRSFLIGQTHFEKDKGTHFNHSLFVKAIQKPNAVILLDEITRAHPEAGNILMSVLDYKQRFLRVDEELDSPTIKVAPGVTFMATANIGNAYTGTRTMDHALSDRFTVVEMEVMGKEDEIKFLQDKYPYASKPDIKIIAEIAQRIRSTRNTDDSNIETSFATRATEDCAGLLNDGFSLTEVAEIAIYPAFTSDGSTDDERSEVKQICQALIVETDTSDEEGEEDGEWPF